MVSMTILATTGSSLLPSIVKVSGKPRCRRNGCSSLESSMFARRGDLRDLLTVKTLSTTPEMAATMPEEENFDERSTHVAWTSVARERWEGELVIQGDIPSWLNGTYLRNGPGIWNIGDYNFEHLFDGYGMLVKLQFENGRLIACHRQIESEAYKAAKKNKKLCYREFATVPKPDNFLAYICDIAKLLSGKILTDNANISVYKLGDGRVLCLTETIKGSILVDPDTLETLGKFKYSDRLGGLVQPGHPIVTDRELVTLLPDLVSRGYVVVRMEAGTNERKVIGRVKCKGGITPGWVHSFAVTERYIVVPEMPLRYSLKSYLRPEAATIPYFEWLPKSKAFMHVMCKASGNIVASVEVPLFMAFHFINAYEEKDQDGKMTAIIADCCETYADSKIIDTFRLANLRSFHGKDILPNSRVGRFTISLDGSGYGKLETQIDPDKHGGGVDICNINLAYLGKEYRYVYAMGAQRPCNFLNALTKLDLVEKKVKKWHDEGSVPSEPYFVARPGATEEDDGVVISIISGKDGGGYAVLLDASTFQEIARAKLPYGLPCGFHGCWIPNNKTKIG